MKSISQCSPFLSAQNVKEFFKLVEHSWASLLNIFSTITCDRKLPYFSPLHTRQMVLSLLLYEYNDQSLVKQMFMIFVFSHMDFQQFQAILGRKGDY